MTKPGMNGLFTLWLLIAGCLSAVVSADEEANIKPDGAEFKSASGAVRAILGDKGTRYSVFIGEKHLYDTSPATDRLDLGIAYISDDGKVLSWVLAERFYGPAVEALQHPAVIFFYDGKLRKSYSLEELLVRPKLVSHSVSHTEWIPELRDGDWKFRPNVTFTSDGSRLQFQTTSFRKYVFDSKTGDVISAEDTDPWKQADVILFGKLVRASAGWQLEWCKFIKGKIDDPGAAMISDPTGTYSEGSHAMALRKKGNSWIAIAPDYELDVIYNVLD